MTKLEEFIAFANGLPKDKRAVLDDTLSAMIATHESDLSLSDAHEAELERRYQESSPEYAELREVEEVFGHKFKK